MESAAALDVLVAVGAFLSDEITPGKAQLFSIVNMLSKMTEYPQAAREEMAEYGNPDPLVDLEQEQD